MLALWLKAVGALLIALGSMWVLQGAGVLTWPASSIMLDDPAWTAYGMAAIGNGMVLVFVGTRRGRG